MDNPIQLNEEIAYNVQSLSSHKEESINTLDEPVLETVKRDIMAIADKIKATLSGEGDYVKLRRQWELWGPLVISLVTAAVASLGTKGNAEDVFETLFIGLWIGPLVISLNARFLGAKHPIIPSSCLIIYCSSPIMFQAILVWFINTFLFRSFLFNLILGGAAVVFTLKCNYAYFQSLVPADKSMLSLYPILLFYVTIALFVSMI